MWWLWFKRKKHVSGKLQVSLRYPARWKMTEEERFVGEDGFFQLSAAGSGESTLTEVCRNEAYHKLKPYGTKPLVKRTRHRRQDACLILPGIDQPREMRGQAAFLIQYPQPVTIGGQTYRFLVLWADKRHIQELADTIRFV